MSETADPFHFSTFIAATMEICYLAGTDFNIDKNACTSWTPY